MDPIIKVEHVNLWYDKGKPTEVQSLKNISLEINKGDYVAFFGPSGCGKTSMLYAISGIDHYQEGKVSINGRDITGLSSLELAQFRQKGIGIVFQQFNLVPSLTVLQNVALPMYFFGVSTEVAERDAQKLLVRLEIDTYADRYPFELSGGQQQRVGIARALANDPPIIIADEPLGNLDSANAKNVLEFLKELNEQDGRTVIMVTHEAWSLRDVKTIFYMKDGTVISVEKQTPKTIASSLSQNLQNQLSAVGGEGKDIETLEREQISARALSGYLLRGYSTEEIVRFQTFLDQRLSEKIDSNAFREAIDKPFKDGGVGLWKKKAEKLTMYVDTVIHRRKDIDAIYHIIEKNRDLPITTEIRVIREWLLEDTTLKPSVTQLMAIDQIISDRLRKFIDAESFARVLSIKKFGVGLSFRAAHQMGDKLESILSGGRSFDASNIKTL